MRTTKSKGRRKAAPEITNKKRASHNYIDSHVLAQRAAEHWFLDAACYAKDGNIADACLAAYRGISATRGQHGRR